MLLGKAARGLEFSVLGPLTPEGVETEYREIQNLWIQNTLNVERTYTVTLHLSHFFSSSKGEKETQN